MTVAGIGLRADATEADLHAALALTRRRPDTLATLAIKVTPALRRFADSLGLPLIELSEADIADIPTRTVSPRVQARFGTGSLAEAAALRVAGRGAKLTTLRVTSPNGMATVAIAEGIAP
ncbi:MULTISPECIES: cobalamin biosynthesis protein [Sulfitobacter]|uniref:cobalamin biosynthesis protein n=1 Tax=Sulfitobacter TaxID=60136 RepID=UPI00257AD977|nr:cobalamin biosynthesis protein [Sulfitobacter sp. UBA1132]